MKTVVIIGGGFCGTLAAVNLARLSTDPLRVIIVNYQYPLARGVAYGTARPEHLLNVVARNMSAFPDLPSHFVDWLRTRADFADVPVADLSEQFVPRRIYGDYLQSILFWQTQSLTPPGRTRIEVMNDEVLDIAPAGRGAKVILKGGETLSADRVLLATGNLAPRDIMPPRCAEEHPAYFGNPWRGWHEKLPDSREDVLLVGTGLTMIDVFLTLRAMGWSGKIHAISRNGLLPLPHFKGSDYPLFPPEEPWTLGLRALVALVEEHCARLRASGMNPAVVVDKLRPFTQRIWRSFTLAEKREFCLRHRARWVVVRHRIPPSVATRIETAQKEGGLRVFKGKIAEVGVEGTRLQVTIDAGNGEPPVRVVVGLLVNCTGPQENVAQAQETLFQKLFQRGLVRSDELDMGIEATPDFAVVDKDGNPSEFLFAVGPLLKGTLWETTAVPELRAQTYQVAQAMLAHDQKRPPDWAAETPADLVEYYI